MAGRAPGRAVSWRSRQVRADRSPQPLALPLHPPGLARGPLSGDPERTPSLRPAGGGADPVERGADPRGAVRLAPAGGADLRPRGRRPRGRPAPDRDPGPAAAPTPRGRASAARLARPRCPLGSPPDDAAAVRVWHQHDQHRGLDALRGGAGRRQRVPPLLRQPAQGAGARRLRRVHRDRDPAPAVPAGARGQPRAVQGESGLRPPADRVRDGAGDRGPDRAAGPDRPGPLSGRPLRRVRHRGDRRRSVDAGRRALLLRRRARAGPRLLRAQVHDAAGAGRARRRSRVRRSLRAADAPPGPAWHRPGGLGCRRGRRRDPHVGRLSRTRRPAEPLVDRTVFFPATIASEPVRSGGVAVAVLPTQERAAKRGAELEGVHALATDRDRPTVDASVVPNDPPAADGHLAVSFFPSVPCRPPFTRRDRHLETTKPLGERLAAARRVRGGRATLPR